MADETVSSFINLLWETKGPLAKQLERATVLMEQIQRSTGAEVYDGEKFRMGVVLSQLQGTGTVSETGTINTPKTLDNTKTRIDVGIITVPISFSTKVMEASDNQKAAWLDVVDGKMQLAEEAFRDVINEAWNQDGTALLAVFTGTESSVTHAIAGPDGASHPVNWFWLYEGRIVDCKVRSNGNTVSLGRKIVSYDEDASTVTFDATFVSATTHGIYVEGSYGTALTGFGQIGGSTGTFQEVSRTDYPQWKGNDASPSDVTDLTMARFDAAERKSIRRCGQAPDFWWGDPASLDRFQQNITPNARWAGDTQTLETGFSAIVYRGKKLYYEHAAPAQYVRGTLKRDVRLLTLDSGPAWDQKDGSMFRRFSRALTLEAWLVWMLNLGVKRCNSTTTIKKCAQAVS